MTASTFVIRAEIYRAVRAVAIRKSSTSASNLAQVPHYERCAFCGRNLRQEDQIVAKFLVCLTHQMPGPLRLIEILLSLRIGGIDFPPWRSQEYARCISITFTCRANKIVALQSDQPRIGQTIWNPTIKERDA